MLKRIYSLLLAFSIVLSSIVVIEAAETPADPFADKDSLNIVFIGGSITEGYGSSTYQAYNYTTDRDGTIKNHDCYAGIVGQYFIDKYPDKDVKVYNAGVSGSGSNYGVYRFEEDVLKYNPDMVFIEYAINDRYDAQASIMNLEILVRRLMELENPPVINFIYATDVNYGGVGDYQEKLAQYYGIPSHDIQGYFKKLMQQGRYSSLYELIGDGTHPNDTGYDIYADVIINNLKKRDGSYFVKPLEKERQYTKAVMTRPRYIEAKYAKREGSWSPEEFRGKAGYTSYLPGSTLTIEFYGPVFAAEYNCFNNGNQQRISLEIDGKSYGSTTCYGGSMATYGATGLTNEKHTAVITVLPGSEPGFSFSGFYVDDSSNPDRDSFYGEQEEEEEEEINVDTTAREIYVSLDGHDANEGTIDSPLKTLNQAKRAAAQLAQIADSDIKVIIRGGVYDVGNGLIFNKEDSGKKGSKIIYMPYEGEDVKLTNSKKLPNDKFTLVKDEATLNRIPKIARGKVYKIDLYGEGIDDLGAITKHGHHGKGAGSRMLTINGRKYTIARYPNEDYTKLKDVLPNINGGHQFTYTENKDNWKTATEPWVAAYFYYLWSDDALSIRSIDTDTKTIITNGTHAYGVKTDAPFYIYNLLEELDVPGEWFVDSSKGILYVYPIEDDLSGEMRFTTKATPIVKFNKASYIELRNLRIEETTDYGVEAVEADNITVDGCQIANIGRIGMQLQGTNMLIQNCYLRDMGKGGIYNTSAISLDNGGTLDSNNNVIYNNHIERYSLESRTYAHGIQSADRQSHVLHNTIQNANHLALAAAGTENIIESNEVFNVLKYADDMGAYYVGRTWTNGGNVLKYNYFHDSVGRDMRTNDVWFTQGMYFDDGKAGDTIIGNTFENLNRGIFLHFGKVMHIENNVFMNCPEGIGIIPQSHREHDALIDTDRQIHEHFEKTGEYLSIMPDALRTSHAEYLRHKAAYDARFPWLEKLFDRYILGPVDNKVYDNIFINCDEAIVFNAKSAADETDVRGNVEYPAGTTYDEARQLSGFTHIPSEKEAGIIVDEKKQIGEFRAVYPENGINEVDPKNLVLYWENANGANKYRLIVAEDANFEKVIYDNVLDENFKVFKSLKYNRQKYYWKVYAKSTGNAFTDDWHESTSGVMSFRTTLEEEYKTEALESVIKDSESILVHPKTIEGEEPGQYIIGSKESLKTSIEKTKNEMRLAGPISPFISKQMLINNLTDAMSNNYLSFTNSLNPTTVDISEILGHRDGWVGSSSGMIVSSNRAVFQNSASGFGYQGKILENYKRLKMKATIDVGTGWISLCLRKPTNLTGSVWLSAGYCFLVKPDVLELQRFGGADSFYYTVPNDCIEPGKEVLLEFGAVDTPQGVHITVYVDGVEKFNMYDNTSPVRTQGYFQVTMSTNDGQVILKPAE